MNLGSINLNENLNMDTLMVKHEKVESKWAVLLRWYNFVVQKIGIPKSLVWSLIVNFIDVFLYACVLVKGGSPLALRFFFLKGLFLCALDFLDCLGYSHSA